MSDTILSVLVLAAIAMVIGAIAWWRRGMRKQAALMLVLAAVMVANVAIWLAPVDGAHAPASGALR
ncbi:hypothetical protein B0I00_0189 [Novosphingobium kunmingense]|uniref:Uncharacterized protein n=1 Tax=Novosphingobium kunmingense TaxID=1211806 RepID=A0A2N0I1E1_9SPHN|nr:hypothetical protein [Novosphingobium kunmingense]PKB25008.1 hypothetical protein B0I00_0189 [Novosphingobium kunmingense]